MSSGVAIASSSGRLNSRPMAIISRPSSALSAMAQWLARYTPPSSRQPTRRATRMFTPTEMPMNVLTIRLTRLEVAPTAASAMLPENLPTTITSAALNSSWSIPVAASGRVNCRMAGRIGPSSILIDVPVERAMSDHSFI